MAQFDIWDLNIVSAFNATDNTAWEFTISQPNPLIGSVLQVQLPREVKAGETVSVGINYSTSATGHAFSWLNAEQTAGGVLPYMFTQCEDINCRSVAPMQDTPSTKITYGARVLAKNEFVVKMSANETAVRAFDDNYNESWFSC